MSPVRLHVGVYAYRREALERYVATPVSELETARRARAAALPRRRACRSRWSRSQRRRSRCASSTIPRMSRRSRRRWPRPGSNERSRTRSTPDTALILCDVWGVVHDGVDALPRRGRAAAPMARRGADGDPAHQRPAHRRGGRGAAGADRPAARCWDGIATSGEAGIAALARARRAGRLHRHRRRPRGARRARRRALPTTTSFADLACTGHRRHPARGRAIMPSELEALAGARRAAPLPQPRPGGHPRRRRRSPARARSPTLYEALGGAVEWYGKPHPRDLRPCACAWPAIRRREPCWRSATRLRTDMLGAARLGHRRGVRRRRNPRAASRSRPISRPNTGLATGDRWRSSTASPKRRR